MERLLLAAGSYLFHAFAVLALAGAGVMIFARNAVHSVMGFLGAMIATAACYLLLSAEFLAVAQLLVYAGGIVVLFLFVVMLVEMDKRAELGRFQRQTPYAVAAVLVLLVSFLAAFWPLVFPASAEVALTLPGTVGEGLNAATHNAQAVSRGLYSGYLLPFEILSVILMVALVAAVTVAKPERE